MKLILKAIAVLSLVLAAQYAEAADIERLIVHYSIKHGVDVKLVRAILFQESSLRVSATNPKSSDYGIGQINIRNVQRLGLDKHKLVTDVNYSIEQSVLMLAELRTKYATKDPNWWTRYHSFTPSKRLKYQMLVQRHLNPVTVAGGE